MSLPSRKHYSIEAAAKLLDIDLDDIRYHLKEGTLRYAYPNTYKEDTNEGWLKVSDVSNKVMSCLYISALKNDWIVHQLFTEHGIDPVRFDTSIRPDYVYLPTSFPQGRGGRIGVKNDWDAYPWASAVMELLDGEQVIRIDSTGHPFFYTLSDSGDKEVFSEGVITHEELEKFIKKPEAISLEVVADSTLQRTDQKPFFNKAEADEFTRVINHFGNEYYERNKKIPNPGQLISFVQECINEGAIPNQWAALTKKGQPNTLALSISSSQKKIVVGEKSLLLESIKDRIKNSTKAWKARNKNL